MLLYGLALLLVAVPSSHSAVNGEYRNEMKYAEYDYIIVGAGTAGSIIANRLSEDCNTKVLVLEAGGLPSGISEVPLFSPHLLGTHMDWDYLTEPQEKAFLDCKEHRVAQPRGKVLGGTSTINGQQYVRGERRDFDEWSRAGATGWTWDEVLHYFKKAENQHDPELVATGHYGVGGYQSLTVSEYGTELRQAYYEAMDHLGYNMSDINSGSLVGYSQVTRTVGRDGLRCSTEKAFLRPASSRDNLDILVHAHATQVLFDENKRAHSVHFEHNNASHVVRARKEIVLSAGVYGSAQLLILSGIGPRQHLEDLKIPVISDLPVGENLQDHITVGGHVYLVNNTKSLVLSQALNPETIGDMLDGKGPLTVPASVECLAVLNSPLQDPSENWPDVRFFFASSMLIPQTDEKSKALFEEANQRDAFTVLPTLARPKSKGYVRLRSKNPHEYPIIDPQYLAEDEDLQVLVESMKMVEQMVSTPALQRYNPVRIPQVVSGCEKLDPQGDLYRKCWARRMTLSSYHPCCTCKMGRPTDPTTVVDPQLRVKGVSGLRVADASIMPSVTSGNTMAPCIMIGEKAADLLKGRRWDPQLTQVLEVQ